MSELVMGIGMSGSGVSSFDSRVMDGYGLDDLDKSTLVEFKGKGAAVFPDKGCLTSKINVLYLLHIRK